MYKGNTYIHTHIHTYVHTQYTLYFVYKSVALSISYAALCNVISPLPIYIVYTFSIYFERNKVQLSYLAILGSQAVNRSQALCCVTD
jgi:hypothetical protein